MVADALIYHPAVSHYNRFVATTIGRDKALRTVQYFSRFLAWYLYRTNHAQTTVATADAIKKQFGSVRKAMRLGKFVEHLKAAALAADSGALSPVLKSLAVGRQLGLAVFMFFDNLAYIDQSGIKKYEAGARMQRIAFKAWIVGLSCNIAAGFYTLYYMRLAAQKEATSADAEKAVELKKLAIERNATRLQLLSDLCDFTVPTSALSYLNFDDGLVGLAGTTSSLIGLSAAWLKTG